MCLGIPGEIVEILPDRPDLARVDVSGVRRVINVGLLADEQLKPGDWVLIHVGFALSKIDEDEASGRAGLPGGHRAGLRRRAAGAGASRQIE